MSEPAPRGAAPKGPLDPRVDLNIAIGLLLWFAAAFGAGAMRVFTPLPRPALQATLLALTLGLIALYGTSSAFRAWARAVDLRVLILFHVVRFVGVYFLYLHYVRGQLPFAFAVPGGMGDIAVALAAIAAASLVGRARWRRGVLLWNVVGMIDILLVVGTAVRLGISDPGSMLALTMLPLSLLPTFIVPLIIASHVLIFVRLGTEFRAAAAEKN